MSSSVAQYVSVAVAEQIRDFLVSGVVRNAVNMPSISREAAAQIRPYLVLAEKLGRFHGQLCTGSIEQIEIEYSGEAARLDVAPITVAVLKGLLESVTDQVNMVNAPVIAQERGIKVIESKASRSADFTNAISSRVQGCDDRLIVGAVFQGGQPRIVRIDDYRVDIVPAGTLIVLKNNDVPGVIGRVGTILGSHRINIAEYNQARLSKGGQALAAISVDGEVGEPVREALLELPEVSSATVVRLA